MRADIGKGTRRMLAAGAATASLLIAFTGPAHAEGATAAAACSDWSGPNYDTGSGTLKGSYNLKNTPYSTCGNVAYLGSSTRIYFHCWANNDFGNWCRRRVNRGSSKISVKPVVLPCASDAPSWMAGCSISVRSC
jgi:hypothetical protein